MLKISRKTLVISAMAILLVITGILNWKYIVKDEDEVQSTNANEEEVASANFFSTYKSERSANREDEMTYLESVITNANTDTATLNEAQQMKMEIVSDMEAEEKIETILKSKDFEDVIVTFGTTSVNVIVKDDELSQAEVAQILDVITTETEYAPGEVKVIQAQ